MERSDSGGPAYVCSMSEDPHTPRNVVVVGSVPVFMSHYIYYLTVALSVNNVLPLLSDYISRCVSVQMCR